MSEPTPEPQPTSELPRTDDGTPVVDPGNKLLKPANVTMDTAVVTDPQGNRWLIWTFRSDTTTFTLHFNAQAVEFVKQKGAQSFAEFEAAGRSGIVVAKGIPNGLGMPSSRGGY